MSNEQTINKELLKDGVTVKKAYEIDLSRIEEGYLYDNIVVHAENANKAKALLLNETKYENIRLRYLDKELTYLNIPVIRRNESDIIMFEGKEVLKCEIEDILKERERLAKLEEIENNPNITHCYIVKGSYYKPNSCGYTSHKHEAGVYEKADAISHAKFCRDIRLECCYIDEHNRMINDKIAELSSRLIHRA